MKVLRAWPEGPARRGKKYTELLDGRIYELTPRERGCKTTRQLAQRLTSAARSRGLKFRLVQSQQAGTVTFQVLPDG